MVAPRNQNRSQESASINSALHRDVTTIHYVSCFIVIFVLKVVGVTALTGNHLFVVNYKVYHHDAQTTARSPESTRQPTIQQQLLSAAAAPHAAVAAAQRRDRPPAASIRAGADTAASRASRSFRRRGQPRRRLAHCRHRSRPTRHHPDTHRRHRLGRECAIINTRHKWCSAIAAFVLFIRVVIGVADLTNAQCDVATISPRPCGLDAVNRVIMQY